MEFRLTRSENKISINIDDFKSGKKILQVNFLGSEQAVTTMSLLGLSLKNPFVTLQFIFFIHLHAFVLWMKGIRYLKKDENKELQKGAQIWKI